MDLIATELGLDPTEVRRRNMIRRTRCPTRWGWPIATASRSRSGGGDDGAPPSALDKVLDAIGGRRRRAGRRSARGRRLRPKRVAAHRLADGLRAAARRRRAEPKLLLQVSPSPLNPLGVKGVGEGGAIASPAAIANAVCDALAAFGVELNETPVKAEQVLTGGRRRVADPAA